MRDRRPGGTIPRMRRAFAIGLAVWAAMACTAPNATDPAASGSPPAVGAVPDITPAPVGPPVRILWGPLQPQPAPVAVAIEPGIRSSAAAPGLVPATPAQLQSVAGEFVSHFTSDLGFITTLQHLRDRSYNGAEEWTFSTTFAPGPFADHVRELVTTTRENEIRTFHPGETTLENAWVRPATGPFGPAAEVGLVEGTITFTDEVATGAGRTIEQHRWRIRALGQGQFFIIDGAEAPAELAPLAPFDPATLDAELAMQVANHLHTEEAGTQVMPVAPYTGTAYWDARAGAIDWLHELAVRGTLSDRHFERVSARVTRFTPTSYLGDGYATVLLRGTLVETMNGVRHTYPVNESVVFQRFSFAQPFWIAVDGQNDDGTWIANGNYGAPQSLAHG
ncbi:MAG: hypothetical protein QOH08_1250 [Chloroflexota bacterium]|nr:hypothetical protein [Chloroflexota bacterium]